METKCYYAQNNAVRLLKFDARAQSMVFRKVPGFWVLENWLSLILRRAGRLAPARSVDEHRSSTQI